MTPAEQLDYLKSYAARKPNARLGKAIDRLRVLETSEALKPVVDLSRGAASLTDLAASIRAGLEVRQEARL